MDLIIRMSPEAPVDISVMLRREPDPPELRRGHQGPVPLKPERVRSPGRDGKLGRISSRRLEERVSFRETEGKLENPVGVCSGKSQRNK